MLSLPMLTMAVTSLLAATLLALVVRHVFRAGGGRFASLGEAGLIVAWSAFALEALTDGLRIALGAFGDPDLALYTTFARIKIAAAAAAIWGFGVYVVALRDGSTRTASHVLAPFAIGHGLLFLYLFERKQPSGLRLDTWAPRLEFGHDLALPGSLGPALFLFYFLPPVIIAAFYLALVPRTPLREDRFRIVATALAIGLFHLVAIIQFDPSFSGDSPLFPVFGAITVLAGLVAFLAHRTDDLAERALHAGRGTPQTIHVRRGEAPMDPPVSNTLK